MNDAHAALATKMKMKKKTTSKSKLHLVESKPKLHELVFDIDNEQYHRGVEGYSSTQFKDLLKNEDLFIAKHVNKTVAREESAAFDVGSYFHTGVLEPHKLKTDCVVFPGKMRRGEAWEKFKEKNKGRSIVTESQKTQAEGLVKAVGKSEVAKDYLDGDAEVSLFIELAIYQGQIFAPYFGKMLTRNGWVDALDDAREAKKKGYVFVVKVRADMLGETYVSDLKSTTGDAKSNPDTQDKIAQYGYDLSASLYFDMFSLVCPEIFEFVWIFASKDVFNSKCYRATKKNILVGRAKYMKAMIKLTDLSANKWETMDYLEDIEPLPRDLGYLEERDSDLL